MSITGMRRLALAALVAASVGWADPIGSECGRCFSGCINACNQIRAACDDRCEMDCATLFQNDPAAELACRVSCMQVCVDEEQECHYLCQILRDPIPGEP